MACHACCAAYLLEPVNSAGNCGQLLRPQLPFPLALTHVQIQIAPRIPPGPGHGKRHALNFDVSMGRSILVFCRRRGTREIFKRNQMRTAAKMYLVTASGLP